MSEADLSRRLRETAFGETARSLPPECYTDEAFFRLERERVLRPEWHAVARVPDLPEVGDYRTLDLFDEPVVLVRDEKGALRAFSGICLHRAFPFASGSGNTKRFVCPYHRWTYDLDGRLRGAPFMEQVPGFDRDRCRLPELPLEEWQGFVLASADPQAVPLADRMKELDELLDSVAFRDFVEVAVLDFDSPWNWKVMVENFMESYHHQGAHVDTLQRSNPAKGTYAMDLAGPFAALENPAVEGASPFWVFQVFPTLLFAATRGDLPLGTWYEMQIDRHDHFHLRIHVLLPPQMAGDAGLVSFARGIVEGIHLEDIPMCEGVQRGLRSGLWEPGTLSVHEKALRQFHDYLADRLAR